MPPMMRKTMNGQRAWLRKYRMNWPTLSGRSAEGVARNGLIQVSNTRKMRRMGVSPARSSTGRRNGVIVSLMAHARILRWKNRGGRGWFRAGGLGSCQRQRFRPASGSSAGCRGGCRTSLFRHEIAGDNQTREVAGCRGDVIPLGRRIEGEFGERGSRKLHGEGFEVAFGAGARQRQRERLQAGIVGDDHDRARRARFATDHV